MRTFFLISLNVLFIANCFSQIEIKRDTLFGQKLDEKNLLLSIKPEQQPQIRISCRLPSIAENNPLFILDGTAISDSNRNDLARISFEDIISISVLKGPFPFTCYGSLADNGIVLIKTNRGVKETFKISKVLPFKTHTICNKNWIQKLDLYNDIDVNVPSVSINDDNSNRIPNISMRGDDNTIVIVDGVRYDASILNTLNPADIEHVKVATGVAASNYLLNGKTQ